MENLLKEVAPSSGVFDYLIKSTGSPFSRDPKGSALPALPFGSRLNCAVRVDAKEAIPYYPPALNLLGRKRP